MLSLKRLIGVWNELAVLFYFFDLLKIRLEIFTSIRSVYPPRSLFNYLLNVVELDDFLDVNTVMGTLEQSIVTVIFQLQVVK